MKGDLEGKTGKKTCPTERLDHLNIPAQSKGRWRTTALEYTWIGCNRPGPVAKGIGSSGSRCGTRI